MEWVALKHPQKQTGWHWFSIARSLFGNSSRRRCWSAVDEPKWMVPFFFSPSIGGRKGVDEQSRELWVVYWVGIGAWVTFRVAVWKGWTTKRRGIVEFVYQQLQPMARQMKEASREEAFAFLLLLWYPVMVWWRGKTKKIICPTKVTFHTTTLERPTSCEPPPTPSDEIVSDVKPAELKMHPTLVCLLFSGGLVLSLDFS